MSNDHDAIALSVIAAVGPTGRCARAIRKARVSIWSVPATCWHGRSPISRIRVANWQFTKRDSSVPSAEPNSLKEGTA
jgi:hypothetical protein